jgi:hypothetical protein
MAQHHLAALRVVQVLEVVEKVVEVAPAVHRHEGPQKLTHGQPAVQAQQGGGGEVEFFNGPVGVEGKVPVGRKLVEVTVPGFRGPQGVGSRLQLFLLQLQFHLVHL